MLIAQYLAGCGRKITWNIRPLGLQRKTLSKPWKKENKRRKESRQSSFSRRWDKADQLYSSVHSRPFTILSGFNPSASLLKTRLIYKMGNTRGNNKDSPSRKFSWKGTYKHLSGTPSPKWAHHLTGASPPHRSCFPAFLGHVILFLMLLSFSKFIIIFLPYACFNTWLWI